MFLLLQSVRCRLLLVNYYIIFMLAVVIGFSPVDYTIDESTDTVILSVSVQDGNIPESENRIITVTTSDGTAQCMLVLVALTNVDK